MLIRICDKEGCVLAEADTFSEATAQLVNLVHGLHREIEQLKHAVGMYEGVGAMVAELKIEVQQWRQRCGVAEARCKEMAEKLSNPPAHSIADDAG